MKYLNSLGHLEVVTTISTPKNLATTATYIHKELNMPGDFEKAFKLPGLLADAQADMIDQISGTLPHQRPEDDEDEVESAPTSTTKHEQK